MNVKPCHKNQTFIAMIGYVTKDASKPHYKIVTHNVSAQELALGKQDHDALKTSYNEEKKILNSKNLFNESFKFIRRCLHPILAPFEYAVLYMIQSGIIFTLLFLLLYNIIIIILKILGQYILSPEIVTSSSRKYDFKESTILWRLVFQPEVCTIDDIFALIFDFGGTL